MKVSIITSCFNREKTIGDTIQSVIAQDYPDIEYVMVDGASEDNSMGVISCYKDKIATLICEGDNGMYEGINKGIKAATGDVVGLVHSDDVLYSSQTISHIVQAFNQHDVDIVYGDGIFVDENNPLKIVRNWISGDYKRNKVRRGWLPLHPTVYIRRECLAQWGLYDESYKIASDSDFLVRYLYEAGLKVYYLKEYIVRMRMGGMSTNPHKVKAKWKEDLRLYRSHGFSPYWALGNKILSKVPQFVSAKFNKG